ncbi:MAG TPA: hypothetical protein VGH28_33620 [Polyangiaceae bacterium]|jgi:hypothetical protein
MEATSIDGLVAHCQSARFTGILRMRSHEGIGEIWFLSGVADEVHFGVSTADEAMDRMRKATEATYELIARLPHPAGGFKRRFPAKGSVATATPVTLMRYCEQYVLTCTLAVESHDVLVEAKYELGELISVETTASDDGVTAMLEAEEGTYEFTLPRVELPKGTPVLPPSPSLLESIPPPESLGFRALLENKPAAGRPASDEAAVKRKTVEMARQKKSETTPKPAIAKTPPRPAVAKKEKPKPAPAPAPAPIVEKKPVDVKPVEAKPVEAKPVEAKPVETPAAAPVEPPPEPPPAARAEPEKEEPSPAAPPVVNETQEAPPKDDIEPVPPPPQQQAWTWLAVPLLLIAALAYIWWTHRF